MQNYECKSWVKVFFFLNFWYSAFHLTLQIERSGHTNCLLRSSEEFTVGCWRCHWMSKMIKCAFMLCTLDFANGIWVNWLVDLSDSFMWCDHLICKLEWNFTQPCKLFLRHTNRLPISIAIFAAICNWTYPFILCSVASDVVGSWVVIRFALNVCMTNIPFARLSEICCSMCWIFILLIPKFTNIWNFNVCLISVI